MLSPAEVTNTGFWGLSRRYGPNTNPIDRNQPPLDRSERASQTTTLLRSLRQRLGPGSTARQALISEQAVKKQEPGPELCVNQRAVAIWDAEAFIREFVSEDWSHHAANISIDCDITLNELRSIGLLPQDEGSRACRQLIRVPVIHEEVAMALWERLAGVADANIDSERTSGSCSITENSPPSSSSSERTRPTKKLRKQRQRRKQKAATGSCAFCSNICTANAPPSPQKPEKLVVQSPKPSQYAFWQRPAPPTARRLVSAGTPSPPRGSGLLTRIRSPWRRSGWAPSRSESRSSIETLSGETLYGGRRGWVETSEELSESEVDSWNTHNWLLLLTAKRARRLRSSPGRIDGGRMDVSTLGCRVPSPKTRC